jgi:hypothetical protein
MKTRPTLRRSLGVLLALLVFTALPNATLGELCDPAHKPYCELEYGHGTLLYLELATDCPTAATIFYTITYNTPNYNTPCHNGATPCSGTYALPNHSYVGVPYGQTVYINMLAWKLNMQDSEVTSCEQHNPNN